jgi:CheY-like chemotaxis protein
LTISWATRRLETTTIGKNFEEVNVIFQRQTVADDSACDPDDRLWAYIQASGALLQAPIHQLLEHEKELLQLMGRRISEELSRADVLRSEDMPHQRKCQILVVDNHSQVRKALRMLLAGYEDIEVIGEACNGQQAVIFTEACHPDLVVMDINMPKMNGITATGLIKRHRPETIVIGLSFSDNPHLKKAVLQAGASTFIPKQEAGEQLYPAINTYWEQISQQRCALNRSDQYER